MVSLANERRDALIRDAAAVAGLVLLAFAVYLPALRAGYIWDDDRYVTENPMLTAPDGLKQIWFSAHSQSQYFPLVYTTFRIGRMLWGLNPMGYHLINVLLHGANAAVLWIVLRRLQLPGSWLAAAIFAVHPVHVESVAWISELKNVESLFFGLIGLLAWTCAVDESNHVRWHWYLLALLAYLLALLAKTTACTLPVAMLLVLWMRGVPIRRRTIVWLAPFVVAGVAMGLVSIWWEGHLGNYQPQFGLAFTPLDRVLIAARALWFYAWKLVWPLNLTVNYPRWNIEARSPALYLWLGACLFVAWCLWKWRQRIGRPALAGIIFFVVTLLPLIGFISIYTFQYSFVADHYQYAASIGLIALVAGLASKAFTAAQCPGTLRCATGFVVLSALGFLTWQQARVYHDPETLWRDTLAKNPDSWVAHTNLGLLLSQAGQWEEALEHAQRAVSLHPNDAFAQNNLAVALDKAGKTAEAERHYELALREDPQFFMAHNNLALVLQRQGRSAEAVEHFRKAAELNPKAPGVLINLARTLDVAGNGPEALEVYRKAGRQGVHDPDFLAAVAAGLAGHGEAAEAIGLYRRALALAPNAASALVDFANVLASQTNFAEAAVNYRKALQIAPGRAEYHYNLGVVLELQGNTEQARSEFVEALRLRPDLREAQAQLSSLPARTE